MVSTALLPPPEQITRIYPDQTLCAKSMPMAHEVRPELGASYIATSESHIAQSQDPVTWMGTTMPLSLPNGTSNAVWDTSSEMDCILSKSPRYSENFSTTYSATTVQTPTSSKLWALSGWDKSAQICCAPTAREVSPAFPLMVPPLHQGESRSPKRRKLSLA